MKTKTFRIGERAIGGLIKVTINNEDGDITVQPLDWDTKEPVKQAETTDDEGMLIDILTTWTDWYHTELILDWIKLKQEIVIL